MAAVPVTSVCLSDGLPLPLGVESRPGPQCRQTDARASELLLPAALLTEGSAGMTPDGARS